MKIKAIRAYSKKMALTKPYTIAYNTYADVELVFMEVELENGIIGIGSASPSEDVVGENPRQTLLNLQTEFVQKIVGRDIRHFQQIIYEARLHFPNLPGTQAAIDLGLHDAFGKYLGIPIAAFYGQKIKALPTSVTIGIKNITETLDDAENYAQLGFKIIKVKTGNNVEEDIERVLKLNETYKDRLKIRVDANQGYSLKDLRNFIAATQKINIELIEQPLPVGREAELLALNANHRKLLTADESLKDAKAALTYSSPPQPFGIFNIKLMKCGGIMGALEIANIAKNAHIELFWGCNDESIASITAALHVAYACPNTRYLDLDGSFDLAEDLVSGGFALENGLMKINEKAGFGIEKIG
ncbi:MAG: dipeptide epimerase [Saprospiraceae bacterium]|nr:dipeptide epimerase [Saprospiraceae bacterium]